MSNVVANVIDFFNENHIFYDHNYDENEHTVNDLHFHEIFMGDVPKKIHGRFLYIFYVFVEEPPEIEIKKEPKKYTVIQTR